MFDMTAHEKYIFILCCIVFTLLTALTVAMFSYLLSLTLKLIRHGVMDERILIEYNKQKNKRFSRLAKVGDFLFSTLLCIVMLAIFVFSTGLKLNENKVPDGMTAIKVVKSSSMETRHEKNTYLDGVDNRVAKFDLIKVHAMPSEWDLQLYDIVLYEASDGELILHRIVGIEEPNKLHPNQRAFTLQGDAVEYSDRGYVGYGQMKAIYRNERVPMVGSFVMFMQSPAGYLCILLILIAMIATPIMESKLAKAKRERLKIICIMGHLQRAKMASVQVMIFETCDKNPVYHLVAACYWRWLKKQLKE